MKVRKLGKHKEGGYYSPALMEEGCELRWEEEREGFLEGSQRRRWNGDVKVRRIALGSWGA